MEKIKEDIEYEEINSCIEIIKILYEEVPKIDENI